MPSTSEFLVERLENTGLRHMIGVPGDYILPFIKRVNSSKIEYVNATDENHAAFAADAYARLNGIGCVCVTYNVGALKVCNAVAGAYAERSPVLVISGAPGIKERNENFALHHVVRNFENQRKIFKNITCHSIILDDPTKAGYMIDEALELLHYYKQPVYIELPRDISEMAIKYDVYRQGTPLAKPTDAENLKDAIDESREWLKNAKNPVILAGVQLSRYNLEKDLLKFAERHSIPIAVTLLSKSTIDEDHPLFAGVYSGPFTTNETLRNMVDESDCLLVLGEVLTDMTLGFQSPKFSKRQTIYVSVEELKVKNHLYNDVNFPDFCKELFKSDLEFKVKIPDLKSLPEEYISAPDTKLSTKRLFEKVQSIIRKGHLIVADIGECLFGSAELKVPKKGYLGPAFYCSMGFSIPAALGASLATDLRPIVLIGDGAFQMAVSEISTLIERKTGAIIYVLNNKGYTTERFIMDGKFNDLRNWNYEKVTELFGGGNGFFVTSEGELDDATQKALASKDVSIINVQVDSDDITPGLRRIVNSLSERVS